MIGCIKQALSTVVSTNVGTLLLGQCRHTAQKELFRTNYANKWMRRDVRRRIGATQYNNERIRLNAIRKNQILPKELREQADLDISSLPGDAYPTRLVKRCAVTSKARGVVNRWRLSRIQWRMFADYNYLSGVTTAKW